MRKNCVKLTELELNIKLKQAFDSGVEHGIMREREASKTRFDYQRIELCHKLINSIGQTQQQFADMLHEDGLLGRLLKQ